MNNNYYKFDSSNIYNENYANFDGTLGLIYFTHSNSTYYKYASYITSIPTHKFIYNIAFNKMYEGFIGSISSIYNRIPLCNNDLIFKYDNILTQDIASYILKGDFDNLYNHENRDYSKAFWHIPMWLKPPKILLTESLRIVVSKIAYTIKKDIPIYIGICHKENLHKKRLLAFTYSKDSLHRVGKSAFDYSYYIEIVKKILNKYNGYTTNAYFTWYHLPYINAVEHGVQSYDAYLNFKNLPEELISE